MALRLVTSLALLSSIRPAASPRLAPTTGASPQPSLQPRRHSFQQHRAFSSSSGVGMASLSYPRPTVIEPKAGGKPTAAVFIMHGLGDTAAGWEDVAYQLRSALPYARFILPTAPTRPISLNAGYAMPGWYDIHSLDSLQGREDGPGVAASAAYINGLLEKTMAEVGIAPDRVVMAGFSQGGAMALAMLGKVPGKLAGVISMSGYLPMTTNPSAPPLTTPANAATPVLFCHGDADQVVKYGFGVASADALKAAGVPVAFKTYGGMGHSACPAELSDVAAFLSERLPPV